MPIFEYKCGACKHSFEHLVFKSDEKVPCPACGSEKVIRQLSGFAVGGADKGSVPSLGGCKPVGGFS